MSWIVDKPFYKEWRYWPVKIYSFIANIFLFSIALLLVKLVYLLISKKIYNDDLLIVGRLIIVIIIFIYFRIIYIELLQQRRGMVYIHSEDDFHTIINKIRVILYNKKVIFQDEEVKKLFTFVLFVAINIS